MGIRGLAAVAGNPENPDASKRQTLGEIAGYLCAFDKGSALVLDEQSPLTPNGTREKIQVQAVVFS